MTRRIALFLAAVICTVSVARISHAAVTCSAENVWTPGKTTITINHIDRATGVVNLTGKDASGAPWSGRTKWTYKTSENLLHGWHDGGREWRLTVEERALRGSYKNLDRTSSNRNNLVFNCDGPTSGVFVGQK